jgi:dihydrolipoamide dehydrogenase
MDIPVMQQRKRAIVEQLTSGIEALLKANKVTALRGHGRLLEGNRVEVTGADGETQILEAGHVVLATGSTPIEMPGARFDGERIVDSAGALRFAEVPKRLGVIGAGVIGLELGSVWRRLGAEVVLLEAMDEFLTAVDRQVAKEALRQFKSQGLDIRLGAKVTSAERQGDEVRVSYEQSGESGEVVVDRLIVCVGRRPFTGGLFGDGVEAKLDQRGFIDVDEHCRTSLPKVWAVGDVVRGPMLAHKGTEEGVMVADLIAGRVGEVNYRTIPSVIYTAPEIAWVGKTEEELKERGPRLQGRQLRVCAQRPGEGDAADQRLREAAGRQRHRRDPRRAHHRAVGRRADRRSGAGDGIRGFRRGHTAHRARASDLE